MMGLGRIGVQELKEISQQPDDILSQGDLAQFCSLQLTHKSNFTLIRERDKKGLFS